MASCLYLRREDVFRSLYNDVSIISDVECIDGGYRYGDPITMRYNEVERDALIPFGDDSVLFYWMYQEVGSNEILITKDRINRREAFDRFGISFSKFDIAQITFDGEDSNLVTMAAPLMAAGFTLKGD